MKSHFPFIACTLTTYLPAHLQGSFAVPSKPFLFLLFRAVFVILRKEKVQREIKVSGILYQANETILNTIRNILKDSLVGIKHDIEVIVL
jgi:hypothetical protein